MFSIMVFMFLGFCGVVALLGYLILQQERLNRKLQEELAQVLLYLRARENQNQTLGAKGSLDPLKLETERLLNLKFDLEDAKPRPEVDPALDLHMN